MADRYLVKYREANGVERLQIVVGDPSSIRTILHRTNAKLISMKKITGRAPSSYSEGGLA